LNPGSTNNYTKFGQLIIGKFIKIIATRSRCHIIRLRCSKFDSRRLSVRSSVRPFVRVFDTVDDRVAATATRRDGDARGGCCRSGLSGTALQEVHLTRINEMK